MSKFTKSGLIQFLDIAIQKGLVNTNTGNAWKAAINKVLADVGDEEDVQGLDVRDAILRHNNKFPGELTGESLKKYEQRATAAIQQFVRWKTDPLNYRAPSRGIKNVAKDDTKTKKRSGGSATGHAAATTSKLTPSTSTAPPPNPFQGNLAADGLTVPFPLRHDFIAQVRIPTNFSTEEAKRLSVFVQALGHDIDTGSKPGKS